MVDGCDDVQSLTDDVLRSFLDKEATESATVITQDKLSKMVESLFKMDMTVKSAKGRMKLLFMEYKSLLRTNGLKWVTEMTPKVAIKQILSVIKPAALRARLEQDIDSYHVHLKFNFTGFMTHAIDLSDAFKRVDCGTSKSRNAEKDYDEGKKRSPAVTRVLLRARQD